MIVVYDPLGEVAKHDLELRRFDCEYHEKSATFMERAPMSAAAIVVLHDELKGVRLGGSAGNRRKAATARLRALVRTLGPIPVVVVRGPGLHYTRLRRAGVECVLPHTKLDRLPELLDDLLAESVRFRLADAVEETGDLGVPELIRRAFVIALRAVRPPRSCPPFSAAVHKTSDTLRDILGHSPAGRAGLALKWFVDAAILVHAAELAARYPHQVTVALELGISEDRLAAIRARVLGREWKWSEMKDADRVAQAIWSGLPWRNSGRRNSETAG
jgi:hypothetical protein